MKVRSGLWALIVFLLVTVCACDQEDVCTDVLTVDNTSKAKLFYPCGIEEPAAATTLMNGYSGSYTAMSWLAETLASNGYIVLAADPVNKWGTISGWRKSHESCVDELGELKANHPDVKGMIAMDKVQVMGFSKGGGGALWAASNQGGAIKSAIGLAPWNDAAKGEPLSADVLSGIKAATLIQAGGNDNVATPKMTENIYGNLPGDVSKAYFQYENFGHLAWTGFATQAQPKHELIASAVLAWMKYYLDEDRTPAVIDTLNDENGTLVHEWIDLNPLD